MSETARQLLARADREKRTVAACESLQNKFRLGLPLAVKKGFFGKRSYGEEQFHALTDTESLALYLASQIVAREANERARQIEARVTTEPSA